MAREAASLRTHCATSAGILNTPPPGCTPATSPEVGSPRRRAHSPLVRKAKKHGILVPSHAQRLFDQRVTTRPSRPGEDALKCGAVVEAIAAYSSGRALRAQALAQCERSACKFSRAGCLGCMSSRPTCAERVHARRAHRIRGSTLSTIFAKESPPTGQGHNSLFTPAQHSLLQSLLYCEKARTTGSRTTTISFALGCTSWSTCGSSTCARRCVRAPSVRYF